MAGLNEGKGSSEYICHTFTGIFVELETETMAIPDEKLCKQQDDSDP